jgi:hypothetical protein
MIGRSTKLGDASAKMKLKRHSRQRRVPGDCQQKQITGLSTETNHQIAKLG